MIFFVGDIHGCFGDMFDAIDTMAEYMEEKLSMIIQIGDFGYWPDNMKLWKNEKNYAVYFIDGNHEHFSYLHAQAVDGKLPQKNLHYIPRGTVMELEGKLFAFCGGGESVDYKFRQVGQNLFREERVMSEDVERVIRNVAGRKVDYLITHTPPSSVIAMNFPDVRKIASYDLPKDWQDKSAQAIQWLWEQLDYPKLICGHMHQSIRGPKYQILDINEVTVICGEESFSGDRNALQERTRSEERR